MMKRISMMLLAIFTVSVGIVAAADQVFFYHTDPVGTPLAMTNASGAVVWQADYKPFGEENTVTANPKNNKRFVGKEKDEETGLSYFGARYEDARTGRFIAVDQVRAVDPHNSRTNERLLGNPQRLNSYTYALNNPYRYVDPDGHHPVLIGLGIIWFGEMMMPQTMGSSHRNSFIDKHWGDLLMLPIGMEREGVSLAYQTANSTTKALQKVGLNYSGHAIERMSERGITNKMVERSLEKGTKYWDPKNTSVVHVLNEGFASGRSLLVAQDPISGTIKTVIRGFNQVRPRFIPL